MESVCDISSIDLGALAIKSRAPAYNGVETFDIEYEETGPLYVACAIPIKVVKGVRTDREGREFIILNQKNMSPEMIKALSGVVESLATQSSFLKGYAPIFPAASGAFGLAHDTKVYDRMGRQMVDYKNKSGHYRIMFAFDTAVIRDEVLATTPWIQQLQFLEELKCTFDRCYWATPASIKVCSKRQLAKKKPKPKRAVHLIAERRMRKQGVHGQVGQHAGLGLDECANFP